MDILESVPIFVFNGIALGMIYFLIAIGLTIIFGMMGVINFAHGALYAIGAYLAYTTTLHTGNFWLSLAVAPVIMFGVGIGEYFLLRWLYGVEPVYQLLLTFGLALIMQEVTIIIWGSVGKPLPIPAIFRGFYDFGIFTYPKYRIFLIVFTAAIAFIIWFSIMRTQLGAMIRAGTEDSEMVNSVGINISRLFTLVFGLGASMAGLGGVLAAPIVGVEPFMGMNILIISFVVVVVGGLGSYGGAVLGGLLIGIIQSLCILFFPAAAAVVVFAFMAVILIVKPEGLLGKVEVNR
jgi:branched-chain amino acid transport system permease protein